MAFLFVNPKIKISSKKFGPYLTSADDGPHPFYTEPLLDGLKERGVHVTFFVTGEHAGKMQREWEICTDEGRQIPIVLELEKLEIMPKGSAQEQLKPFMFHIDTVKEYRMAVRDLIRENRDRNDRNGLQRTAEEIFRGFPGERVFLWCGRGWEEHNYAYWDHKKTKHTITYGAEELFEGYYTGVWFIEDSSLSGICQGRGSYNAEGSVGGCGLPDRNLSV